MSEAKIFSYLTDIACILKLMLEKEKNPSC